MKIEKSKVLIASLAGVLAAGAIGCGVYFGIIKNRSDFPDIEPLVITNKDEKEGYIHFNREVNWSFGAPLVNCVYVSTDGIHYDVLENHELYGHGRDSSGSKWEPNSYGMYLKPGEKLYVVRTNEGIISGNLFEEVSFKHSLSGNVGALINGLQELPLITSTKTDDLKYFYNLFAGDYTLIEAHELKIPFAHFTSNVTNNDGTITGADGAFTNMFAGCSNLTTMPKVPSFNGACGMAPYMFAGCSSAGIKMKLTSLISNENVFYVCDEYNSGMFSSCNIPTPASGTNGDSTSNALPGFSYYTE